MGTAASSSFPPEANGHRRRILVCLERSAFSEVCVPYAISLAKTFKSAITLLHVMQPQDIHAGPQANDALSWEITRQEALGHLERIKIEVEQALGQPVDMRLEQGHPAERILDVGRELACDLIVLGSHGESGVTPWNLGSTVQQVLAVTRRSVLIVHSSTIAPTTVSLKRILVPLDGCVRTESVLPAAARLASEHNAEILLAHVVHEPIPTTLLYTAEDMALAQQLASRLESGAKRYLERLQQQLQQQQLRHKVTSVVTSVLRHANERQCLLEFAQKEHPDIIVLSAHGAACDSARPFGSVTSYLLTHSMVPLLVLQDLPECDLHQANEFDTQQTISPLRASYASERT